MDSFEVHRELQEGRYKLREIFCGLDNVQSLGTHLGDTSLKQILDGTEVTISNEADYMYVNDVDGSLVLGLEYLRTGEDHYLYLDIIHELIHVKQYLDGRKLFDESYSYVDRPTEIEAYQFTVNEARKIGMSDEAIAEYLYVEWITRPDHRRLLRTLGVQAKK